MHLILVWALVALIGQVQCKCSLVPLLDDVRSDAYACTHADLHDLDEVPNEADWIEFTVSRFHLIPDNAFWRFKNLKRLSFYNCHIKFISPDAFAGLERLEWLIFHGSKIYVARTPWFRPMKNLRKLIFDRCGLVHIESGVFRLLPSLEILSLRDNDLDCLSTEDLTGLRMLKVVRTDENPWVCECGNRLHEYFKSRNIIQEVECTKQMHNCKGYQCMAPVTFQLLPTVLTKQRLNEFHNQERTLIQGNEFETSVFESLDKLPDKTAWIEIANLHMDVLPKYAFFRFGNSLQTLDLIDCRINTIESEAFAGLHKLQRLALVGNRFSVLAPNWFRDLVSLQQLILRRNDIRQIERTALWHVGGSLRHLDIGDNLLRCIALEELAELKKLERLDGIGNPWICSCYRNLQNFLMQRKILFDINNGRCYENGNEITDGSTVWKQPEMSIRNTTTTTGVVHWTSFEETIKQTNASVTFPFPSHGTVIDTVTPQSSLYTGSCYREKADRRLIYSCKAITSVEDLNLIPPTAHTIKVTQSNIKIIPRDSFIRFANYLSTLELVNCGIVNIKPHTFSNMHNLESLSLRNNLLESISEDILCGMDNLKHVDLSHNNIHRITNNVFDCLPHLISLDISHNSMNCIGLDYMARRLHKLAFLNVRNNPWSCLCGIKLEEYLNSLNMKYDINSSILKGDCYATSVPMTTTPVPPDSVTEAPLQNATVEGTCTRISNDAQGMRYRCSNGNLLLLQSVPTDAVAIEFLDGHLFHIPPKTFSKFTNLKELVIINSELSKLEQGTFHGLDNLENLTIQENPLERIGTNWFTLSNLRRLNLRGNSIKYIEPGSFQHLNQLMYLNLEGNDLKCIYTSDLDNLKNIYIVEFSENPLKWRCRLGLEQYLDARNIKFIKIHNSCEGKKLMSNLLLQNRTDGSFDCPSDCSGASIVKLYSFMFLPILILLY